MSGLYEANNMRGMMNETYNDGRISKQRELNDSMSIDTSKSEDQYGQQVHSLSKQSFNENIEEA